MKNNCKTTVSNCGFKGNCKTTVCKCGFKATIEVKPQLETVVLWLF